MTPETRDSLVDLVGEAMSRPPPEREAWIRAACPDGAALDEALSLLKAAHDAGAFLDRPTMAAGRPAAAVVNGEAPGGAIGRYRLLELIGEGGFGRVFMAEQREPVVRRVAVKIIKAGMDTAQVVARFEAERQALAMMDHPGIATVFDGGATETGRPYFVMELVRGLPITAFCDGASMPIPDRLRLFCDVCGAVQHAHQKGVIHRDLKPANVLVAESDGKPQPKIIDFGIAKATSGRLTDRTLYTEYRQFIGTPEYMSPEQALGAAGGAYAGADVDTRSDIYSLGVLLYELLTGTTPLERARLRTGDLAEMQRLIRDSEPPAPSTRLATLETRADVAAHRRSEPKRLGMLLRGDLDWIVLKAVEKDRSRRYDTAAALSEDVRRFLGHEPVSATPPSASYRLRKFVRRNRGLVGGAAAVGAALILGAGAALWQASVAARERDAARAAESETRRVAEFQAAQLRGIAPHLMGARLREDLIAATRDTLSRPGSGLEAADVESRLARLDESLAAINLTDVSLRILDRNIFERAIQAANAEFADQPAVRAGLLLTIADSMRDLGLAAGAEPAAAQGLEIRRRTLGDDHELTIQGMTTMASILLARGDLAGAERGLSEALERSRRGLGSDHPAAIDALSNMARLRRFQDRNREAEAMIREVLERNRRVRGPAHERTLKTMSNLGSTLAALGRLEEAEPFAREAAAGLRRTLGDDDPDTLLALSLLGQTLRVRGRLDEAEPLLREGLEKRRRLLGEDHPNTLHSLALLGSLLEDRIARGDSTGPDAAAEAEAVHREVLDRRRRRLGNHSAETLSAALDLGELLLRSSRPAEAVPFLREAADGFAEIMGEGTPSAVIARLDLARALARLSRFNEAESLFLAIASGGAHGGAESMCAADLAALYEDWDRAEPGEGYDAKAAEWGAKASAAGGR